MEPIQDTKRFSVTLPLLLISIVVVGYVLFLKYHSSNTEETLSASYNASSDYPLIVRVENTPMVNGVLSAPVDFPQDIPLEESAILESSTTVYPAQSTHQLSVSYESESTVAQKYAEYKNYMATSGYEILEENNNSSVATLSGTKEEANLSVTINTLNNVTLVQISFLEID